MKKLIACLALGYNPKGEKAMRKSLAARILTLLAGILLCTAFSVPAQAGSQTVTLDRTSTKCAAGTFCDYKDVDSGAGYWSFDVKVTGKVSLLGLQIKDNAPGAQDICWGISLNKPSSTGLMTSPTIIPAADYDVCGTQWLDDPKPTLSLFAYIQTGDSKAKVEITFYYPDPTVAVNGRSFKKGDSRAADVLRDQYILEKKERYGKPARA